jgi:hypothetical protein
MRSNRWSGVFIACSLCCLSGCTAADSFGLNVDLSHLNWQTGALIALAYFANSKGHFAAAANTVRSLLQQLRILPAVTTPEALSAEKLALVLADLFSQLQGQPELQAKVLSLMQASSDKAVANAAAK